MDIKQIRPEIEHFFEEMKKDNKSFSFVAIDYACPGISNSSCVIKVKADWFSNMSCKQIIDYMVDKMFETIDKSKRIFINSFEILDKNERTYCSRDCIILTDDDRNNNAYFI